MRSFGKVRERSRLKPGLHTPEALKIAMAVTKVRVIELHQNDEGSSASCSRTP
jgi:hypothetical protein